MGTCASVILKCAIDLSRFQNKLQWDVILSSEDMTIKFDKEFIKMKEHSVVQIISKTKFEKLRLKRQGRPLFDPSSHPQQQQQQQQQQERESVTTSTDTATTESSPVRSIRFWSHRLFEMGKNIFLLFHVNGAN